MNYCYISTLKKEERERETMMNTEDRYAHIRTRTNIQISNRYHHHGWICHWLSLASSSIINRQASDRRNIDVDDAQRMNGGGFLSTSFSSQAKNAAAAFRSQLLLLLFNPSKNSCVGGNRKNRSSPPQRERERERERETAPFLRVKLIIDWWLGCF